MEIHTIVYVSCKRSICIIIFKTRSHSFSLAAVHRRRNYRRQVPAAREGFENDDAFERLQLI